MFRKRSDGSATERVYVWNEFCYRDRWTRIRGRGGDEEGKAVRQVGKAAKGRDEKDI